MTKNQDLRHSVRVKNFKNISRARGFTLIELMLVVMILGVLAATAAGMFSTYQARSKTVEAVQGVSKIANGEIVYYQKNTTFLAAGPTNIPPSSAKVAVNFGLDPSWTELTFGYTDPIYFGYQASLVSPTSVDCEAQGDLDGDGNTSIFRQNVSTGAGGAMTAGGLQIFDEIE